jgi:hypothetical protein
MTGKLPARIVSICALLKSVATMHSIGKRTVKRLTIDRDLALLKEPLDCLNQLGSRDDI